MTLAVGISRPSASAPPYSSSKRGLTRMAVIVVIAVTITLSGRLALAK